MRPRRNILSTIILCLVAVSYGLPQAGRSADKQKSNEKSWAYRTPLRPNVPTVKDLGWIENPIDAFVLARLEEERLRPSPIADRAVLIRRLTFDLHGLPPTPQEVQTFVNDRAADAYERLVDRLLASPRYGQRWAMYWLDLVRFAETDGFKSDDPRPNAWRYRDYVIAALNGDKPYDRFVREQIAGDELYPNDPDALVATGYCRHYPDEFNAVNLEQRRQEILNDITDTTSQAFLGLTMGCARCHDHKFDPILQTDYYRLQAFFAAYQPADLPVGPNQQNEDYRKQLRSWEAQTAELRKKLAELEAPHMEKAMAKRKGRFPKEYLAAWETPAEKRTPLQQQIAFMIDKQVQVPADELSKAMKPEVRTEWQSLSKRMGELARQKPQSLPTAMAMTDVGPVAPTTFLLKRGEWRQPGQEVLPGFPSAIDDRNATLVTNARGGTGRRAALADWLSRPENPLTARVLVNRLWQQHFGRGIVATPSDFGNQGESPTHPELLDWLAIEFISRGWSQKAIHKLIVTSATYKQSSSWNASNAALDPDNRLLWRMNRRKLEGEALRDAMLASSGELSESCGGPGVYPELPSEISVAGKAWPVSSDARERHRRSVYIFVKRNLRYPLFSVFDAPDGNETCALRHQSINAPQALTLLNSKIVQDRAHALAARLTQEVGNDPPGLIDRAVKLTLGRAPEKEEKQTLLAFLQPFTTDRFADLCHALFNLNEFLYVD